MIHLARSPLFLEAPVAYWILDRTGRELATNLKFRKLFGYGVDAELTAAGLTHEDDRAAAAEYVDALISGRDAEVSIEQRYVCADGTVFWGRVTARTIEGDDGELLLLGVIDDIQAERELRDELTEAAQRRSEFVARVSHELRNPLHIISGLAELIAMSDAGARERGHAETIGREAVGLSHVVGDLLDISRSQAGKLELDIHEFSLRTTAERAVHSVEANAKAKHLALNLSIDEDVPLQVLGDDYRLRQILVNLLVNAVKFTAEGTVSLEVCRGDGSAISFVVTDTGQGVPVDQLDEIFEPFVRLNSAAAGAGLGLAISRHLAGGMGGALHAENVAEAGVAFTLVLPFDIAPDEATSGGLPDSAPALHRNNRVLIVEDTIENQLLATGQLDALGFPYDVAENGYVALELTANTAYAAILMDWHLPGINGLETTRRIRQRERSTGATRTPIIAVTARAMLEDIDACFEAGVDDHVSKPASLDKIDQALRRWITSDCFENVVMDSSTFIDVDTLTSLATELGDSWLVVSLAETFLDELQPRVNAIVLASPVESGLIEVTAHVLSSTCGVVGAVELGRLAAEVERSAHEGRAIDEATRTLLQDAADQTRAQLLRVLATIENQLPSGNRRRERS